MSEYIFKLPDLAEGTVEAEIGEWLVKAGDEVSEEDVICTMITDKAAVEITSPVNGRVRSLSGDVGSRVSVGSPLIVSVQTHCPNTVPKPIMKLASTTSGQVRRLRSRIRRIRQAVQSES